MAITERTATLAESASAQTVTGTVPASTVAGDLMVAVFCVGGTLATMTLPAGGWTAFVTATEFIAARVFAAYYKFAVGSDTGPTISFTSAAGRVTCIMQTYVGVNATPLDVAAALTTGSSATPVLTGVTTVTANAMVLSGCGGDWSTGTWTKPTALTLQKTHTSGTGRADALADAIQAAAGATGTQTWSDTAGALSFGGMVAALRPAAAAAGGGVLTSPSRRAMRTMLTRCQKLTQRKSGLFVPEGWAERIALPA